MARDISQAAAHAPSAGPAPEVANISEAAASVHASQGAMPHSIMLPYLPAGAVQTLPLPLRTSFVQSSLDAQHLHRDWRAAGEAGRCQRSERGHGRLLCTRWLPLPRMQHKIASNNACAHPNNVSTAMQCCTAAHLGVWCHRVARGGFGLTLALRTSKERVPLMCARAY